MKSTDSLNFTNQELKEKEENLLRLFKKTIIEYKKARRQQWLKNGKLWPLESSNLKSQVNFKHNKISIIINDDHTGTVVVWGKQNAPKSGRNNRNLRIVFQLDVEELVLKAEIFTQYPLTGCDLIKDIFRRLNIQTEEDYKLLTNSFQSLIISYI